MDQPLWQPTADQIAQSNLQHFINFVNKERKLNLKHYQALYRWSIANRVGFWTCLWQFAKFIASRPYDEVLVNGDDMLKAQWFVGSQLNFAENLLKLCPQKERDKATLIFVNETGQRREISYSELSKQVAKVAKGLQKLGITQGDRVAAMLPNIPETVIAMLATTSLGALWSSASPDFGIQGIVDRFGQIEPKILLTTDGYHYNGKQYDCIKKIKSIQQQLPSLVKTIVVPYLNTDVDLANFTNTLSYQTLYDNEATTLNFTQLPFNHPIYIMFSSGTTGKPKCIVHGAGGTLLQHYKELALHTDLKANDTIFYFTTCGWMMWNWLISSLMTGATILLYDGSPFFPRKRAMFDLIDQEKITVFGTSARFISAVEKNKLNPNKTHKLNSLKKILSTGSPLLPENFDFVYQAIKPDICLSSISGGTDIISCFALGNPLLPVYRSEIQCLGLGMKVEVFNDQGDPIFNQQGELVCTKAFPSQPVYFWNDPDNKKYRKAYFEKFPNVWVHGDYAQITEHGGLIISGRSDTVLNPSGIRIGTAEIYQQLAKIPEVIESVVIGQKWQGDERVVLFVKCQAGITLEQNLKQKIREAIKAHVSIHHVPKVIKQVPDIPVTKSGKIVELAVRDVVEGREVKNKSAIANPESLEYFKAF